ncbi:Ig-like domain-containing protein [Butyrivibrio sp. WCD2001]|uniref:Ig-like domain-containing protein n=1 Tax=Butyrivibrio sp. WCD2001 TaxID=1280681 RepID=UPI0003F5B966|nr:Ig-like domain-containing protein [Butyrivibrio sp. WCD2001]
MQNSLKRINFTGAFFVLVFVMLIGFVTPMKVSAAPKLNKKQIEIKVGKTYKLKVKGTSNKVKWSSIDKKTAKVSKKGVVTAKKVGKTIVKAKVGKKTLKCEVNVICNKHQFEEKIIREATKKKSGEKCKVCVVCGFETEHEEIPRIESDDKDEEESDTQDDSSYVPRQEGLTELEVKNRLAELKAQYAEVPEDYWDVYIYFITKQLYGDEPKYKEEHTDLSRLKAGDQIKYYWTSTDNPDDIHLSVFMVTNIDNNDNIYIMKSGAPAPHVCTPQEEGHQRKGYWDEEGHPSYKIIDIPQGKFLGSTNENITVTAYTIYRYY